MNDLITNLEKLYSSGNTWAEALALIGSFLTLYILKKLRDMKQEQNKEDTLNQKAVDQASNRTANQKLEDQSQVASDDVEKKLDELEGELQNPKDPKVNN